MMNRKGKTESLYIVKKKQQLFQNYKLYYNAISLTQALKFGYHIFSVIDFEIM